MLSHRFSRLLQHMDLGATGPAVRLPVAEAFVDASAAV